MPRLWMVVLFGILAGIDNFQVACSLGLLPRRRKWALAFSFGFCESLLSLIGLCVATFARINFFRFYSQAGTLALLASGLLILYLGLTDRDAGSVADSRWMLFGLPLSLSLDNLVAGAGLGANGYPIFLCAAILGIICSLMSLGGLFLGSWWRRRLPRHATALSGAWLIFIAVYSLVK